MLRKTIPLLLLASPLALASGSAWETGDTRCIPNFRADRPVGYICVKVEPGSLYASTGVRKGDNVTRINGRSLAEGTEKALDLWRDFERTRGATLEVERDGKLLTLRRPDVER
jgi:type II secretory pathway component PulC